MMERDDRRGHAMVIAVHFLKVSALMWIVWGMGVVVDYYLSHAKWTTQAMGNIVGYVVGGMMAIGMIAAIIGYELMCLVKFDEWRIRRKGDVRAEV
jgi:hypothetical protein